MIRKVTVRHVRQVYASGWSSWSPWAVTWRLSEKRAGCDRATATKLSVCEVYIWREVSILSSWTAGFPSPTICLTWNRLVHALNYWDILLNIVCVLVCLCVLAWMTTELTNHFKKPGRFVQRLNGWKWLTCYADNEIKSLQSFSASFYQSPMRDLQSYASYETNFVSLFITFMFQSRSRRSNYGIVLAVSVRVCVCVCLFGQKLKNWNSEIDVTCCEYVWLD